MKGNLVKCFEYNFEEAIEDGGLELTIRFSSWPPYYNNVLKLITGEERNRKVTKLKS